MRHRGLWLLILGMLWLGLSHAAVQPDFDRRYAAFVLERERPAPPVGVDALDALPESRPERAAWEAFRRQHAGSWSIWIDRRSGLPAMATGRIQWFDPAAGEARSREAVAGRAVEFLERHASVLGPAATQLRLDEGASSEVAPGKWFLSFQQARDGVVVENARMVFHLIDDHLVQFGAHRLRPLELSAEPSIDAGDALDAVLAYLGVDGANHVYRHGEEGPELLYRAVQPDPNLGDARTHRLLWRIRFQVEGEVPLWTAEVDAHDGSLFAFYDGAHYARVRGGVYPVATDESCVDLGCEVNGYPMPFADYSVDGGTSQTADESGAFTCDPGSSVAVDLTGPFVTVNDICGVVAETRDCEGHFDLELKAGQNCEVGREDSPGNTGAARSAFYHTNRIAQMARSYLPGNAWLNAPVTVNTNVGNFCNATWSGEMNMFRFGNGCSNTGENSGLLTHEWGHGLDENDGGGFENTSEAYADTVALFYARESCIARGFDLTDNCGAYGDTCLDCTGLRDHDWSMRIRNEPATPTGFVDTLCGAPGGAESPCGGQVHCEGFPIVESIFDLATRDLPAMGLDADSAWQLAERLWYESRDGSSGDIYNCDLPDSDSCAATSWYQRMRVADDDDGNLNNGTPHAVALFAAFDRHDIACGLSGDPDNQNTSSCPALAQPVVTVTRETEGNRLSWSPVAGAATYTVLRSDLGCNRQSVLLADTAATAYDDLTADPLAGHFYRVRANGSNPVCASPVSACMPAPPGANLRYRAHRIEDAGALGNGTGELDPGETLRLPLSLFNHGVAASTGTEAILRSAQPDLARVLNTATFPSIAVQDQAESDAPHFEVVVSPDNVCGESLTFELESFAQNAPSTLSSFRLELGNVEADVTQDEDLVIPILTSTPVESLLEIADSRTLVEVDVTVRVLHIQPRQLIVDLVSPEGTSVRLHNLTNAQFFNGINTRYDLQTDPDGPGTMDDFIGEDPQGTWRLQIQDTDDDSFVGPGTLTFWTLHLTVDQPLGCNPTQCPDPVPGEATGLLVDRNGADLGFSWDTLAGAAGYHLIEDTLPTLAGADLAGSTGGATALTLPGAATSGPDLQFFRVRGVNSCNWEGP
ncbi:hypothetical protein ABI59_19695 [Acidobacteria bacterium Mor1]|nr:hypothetical protein ABI59_19695 [Acidobacteria bacterium Mor1]